MTEQTETVVIGWTLGDRLRKARRLAGLTAAELAPLVGVSRQAVASYEVDRSLPRLPVLEAWSDACGVPFEWLCRGETSTKWYSPPSRAA